MFSLSFDHYLMEINLSGQPHINSRFIKDDFNLLPRCKHELSHTNMVQRPLKFVVMAKKKRFLARDSGLMVLHYAYR